MKPLSGFDEYFGTDEWRPTVADHLKGKGKVTLEIRIDPGFWERLDNLYYTANGVERCICEHVHPQYCPIHRNSDD